MKWTWKIPGGFLKKTKGPLNGYKDFQKIVGEVLNNLNVGFEDDCCPALSDNLPVIYNQATGKLQVRSNGTWVNLQTTALSTASSTTSTTTAAPATTTTTTIP